MIRTLRKTLMSFGWNKRLLRCAALSLLLYRAVAATAQDTTPQIDPIYTYEFKGQEIGATNYDFPFPYDYRWTANNTLVIRDVLQNSDSGEAMPITVTFDPYAPRDTAESMLLSTPAPASTPLPPELESLPLSFTRRITTSPDGRFDLYRVTRYEKGFDGVYYANPVLGLVNRQTGDTFINELSMRYVYSITWSANNQAFVMSYAEPYSDAPYYVHVTGFADDLSKVRVNVIDSWGSFPDLGSYQFYGMDSTGRYVMVDGYLFNAQSQQGDMRLFMIDTQMLTYDIIAVDKYFAVADFEQSDDQHVLYVNSQGVFAYDRQTKTSMLLTDDINSDEVMADYYRTFFSAFSPNGRFLSTQMQGEESTYKLHVYPIPPIPEGK
jgi:hypothetical protein